MLFHRAEGLLAFPAAAQDSCCAPNLLMGASWVRAGEPAGGPKSPCLWLSGAPCSHTTHAWSLANHYKLEGFFLLTSVASGDV